MVVSSTLNAFEEKVTALAQALPGRIGIFIRFVSTGYEFGLAADELFPAASVIKVPIMVEVFRQAQEGSLALDEPLPVLAEELTAGSGVLQFLHVGLELTVHDAVELMICVSDNTGTNLLLRRVGGRDVVNATMDRLRLTQTRSGGPIGRPNRSADWRQWSRTTPREMADVLTMIARGEMVSADASMAMRRILEHQQFDDMLPRYLPLNGDSSEGEQPQLTVANKTGALDHVRNDAGIITLRRDGEERHLIVSVFTADLEDDNLWTIENIGTRAVAQVSRLAYETFQAVG